MYMFIQSTSCHIMWLQIKNVLMTFGKWVIQDVLCKQTAKNIFKPLKINMKTITVCAFFQVTSLYLSLISLLAVSGKALICHDEWKMTNADGPIWKGLHLWIRKTANMQIQNGLSICLHGFSLSLSKSIIILSNSLFTEKLTQNQISQNSKICD